LRNIGIVSRCVELYTRSNTAPFEDKVREFVRRVRFLCGLRSLDLNCTVDRVNRHIIAEASDSLDKDGPRTTIHVDTVARAILIGRFAKRIDTVPVNKFRFVFRKLIEFTPRVNFAADNDFTSSGFDPNLDTLVREYDLDDATNTDVGPIDDFGSNDVGVDPTRGDDSQQGAGFQRIFRLSIRFGPLRLFRVVLSFIFSNVRNAFDLGQVTIPGGVNFNAIFDNIPFTRDNTHIAFAFDIESDVDLDLVRKTTAIEVDSSVPSYQDNGEASVEFNDTRRVRFRRIVFCDGGNTLIIRERIVKLQENGITIRRVFITYFYSNRRCTKLLFDPALDNAPPDTVIAPIPPESSINSQQQGSSNGGNPSNGQSGSASFVCFSALLLVFISLLF